MKQEFAECPMTGTLEPLPQPKLDFDEWMSGRLWLGDKAPAEGFYGRYSKLDQARMRIAFEAGLVNIDIPEDFFGKISGDSQYLALWALQVGQIFRRKNEKSE